MTLRPFTARDEKRLVDAIRAGRVYRAAGGGDWRRLGGTASSGHGKSPVARRHMDRLEQRGVAYLDAQQVWRIGRCPACCEDYGWCEATGGPNPCEGAEDQAELAAEALAAPQVPRPLKLGGAA